jgi:hypothetical protein
MLFAQEEKYNSEVFRKVLVNYTPNDLYHGVRNRLEFIPKVDEETPMHIFSNEATIEKDSLGFLVIPHKLDSLKIGFTEEGISDTVFIYFDVIPRMESFAGLVSNEINHIYQSDVSTYQMTKTELSSLKGIMPILKSKMQMTSPNQIVSFKIQLVKENLSMNCTETKFDEKVLQFISKAQSSEVIIISDIITNTNYISYLDDELKEHLNYSEEALYQEQMSDIIIFVQ